MGDLPFDQTLLPGIVVTVMTLGVAAVELLLKFRSRHTWRDTVLQELEIYRQMEQSKSLQGERDAMRALKKSIVETVKKKLDVDSKPVPFFARFLYNISLLLSSVVIGACVIIIAYFFHFLSADIVEAVLMFVAMACGVELVMNILVIVGLKR